MTDSSEGSVVNSKKIAFIQNGVILQVLSTDPGLADFILSNCEKVDITDLANGESAISDDLYDSGTRTITLIRESYAQE